MATISLGDIVFGITPDTSKLQAATKQIQSFGNTVDRAAKSQTEGARAAEAAFRKQEAALISAFVATRKLMDSMNRAGVSADVTDRLTKRFNGLVKALTDGRLSALEFQRAMERFQVGTANSQRALNQHTQTQKDAAKASRDAARALAEQERMIRQIASVTTAAGIAQSRFQNAATQARAPTSVTSIASSAQQNLLSRLNAPGVTRNEAAAAVLAYREEMARASIALQNFNASQTAANRTIRETQQYLRAAETASIQYENRLSAARIANERFQQAARSTRAPQGTQSTLDAISGRGTAALSNLQSGLASAGTRGEAAQVLRNYREEMARATNELRAFHAAHNVGRDAVGRYAGVLKDTARSVELMTGPLGGVAVRLNVLNSILGSTNATFGLMVAGIAAGVFAFVKITHAVIDFEKGLDTAQRGMTAISGSSVDTQLRMRQLMQIANDTGTSFHDLLKPFAGWTESVKGTGLEGERSITIFRNMAQVAGQLGEPFETVNSVFLNLRRMMSSNSVTARELRTRLETELPGAADAAAKALGTTRDQLDKLQKEGINVQEFILKFSQAWADRFGGLNKPVEGITAAQNRWHNSLATLWDTLDKNFHIVDNYIGLLTRLTGWVDKLSGAIEGLRQAFGNVDGAIQASILNKFADILDRLNIGGMTFHDLAGSYRKAGDEWSRAASTSIQAAQNMGSALGGALPALKDFVDQQKQLKFQTDTSATESYLTKVNDQVSDLTSRLKVEKDALAELQRTSASQQTVGPFGTLTGAANGDTATEKMIFQIRRTEAALKSLTDTQKQLNEIRAKPTGPEGVDPRSWTAEMQKAIEDSDKAIEKLKNDVVEFGHGGAAAFKRVKEDAEDTKSIEDFADKLRRAGVTKEYEERATSRVTAYAEALRKVRQAGRDLADIKTPFQVMEDVFKGLEGSINTFTSAIFDGTLSMKTFGNIGKKVLQDLLNEIIKLGILGPLLRSLFGTQTMTLGGSIGGGPGIGGALGNMFSGFFGGGGGYAAPVANMSYGPQLPIGALGMAFTPQGYRYGLGGSILTQPTMMTGAGGPVLGGEAGPEALLPLTRTSGGKLGVKAALGLANDNEHPSSPPIAVHFHDAPGNTRVEQSQNADGSRRLDAYFDEMLASTVGRRGSATQRALGSTMGIRPRTIRRGAA